MSPLDKLQLKKIRDERREQIKQAGLRVFAEHGYDATRTSQIAEEAGISEGLIYRYFSSKEALFTELVEDAMGGADDAIASLGELPGSPYEQVCALTRDMLRESNLHAFKFVQQARRAKKLPAKASRILKRHAGEALIEQLLPLFVRGQKEGQFVGGNPRELLSWYMSVINSLVLQAREGEEPKFPPAEMLMRMLAKTVGGPSGDGHR